jgi:phospholipase/lecithinase/hemolysin
LSFIANDVAAAASLAVPVATVAAPGAPFSAIYAFGDSLTDAGNVSLATAGLVPVAPYADRSFTNGPVWVKDLAQSIGLPAIQPSLAGGTDFAYGGAQTGSNAGAHAQSH